MTPQSRAPTTITIIIMIIMAGDGFGGEQR
jgi:hypothetical protein